MMITDQTVRIPLTGTTLALRWLRQSRKPTPQTLVMLHDSLGSITLWRDFPARLAELTGLDVLLYDREGHGLSHPARQPRELSFMHSEAAVLDFLLKQQGIQQAVLVGHSTGGSIALVAASLFPRRVAGVVTLGSHVMVEEVTLQGVRQAKADYGPNNMRERLAKYHGDKAQAVHDAWTETWLAPAFSTWSIEENVTTIRCPVLAIHGQDDPFGTPAQAQSIEANAAYGRALILEHCGHNPHREAAGQTEAAITAFVLSLFADARPGLRPQTEPL